MFQQAWELSLSVSYEKAFVVGPGHAPIPAKLVSKITSGEFVDLAFLHLYCQPISAWWITNRRPFLDGKLLVSRKRRLVEISDIFTWTEAFTIFQMVMCATHPHRWPDLTRYTLLIIQTARQSPNRAWLEYDLAFHGDAAVGASVQVPRTTPLGTMVYAAGHLGNAAPAMCAVHAMGTT